MDKNNKGLVAEQVGKIFIDLGKLTFGGFILGGILRVELPHYTIIISGFLITLVFVALGIWCLSKKRGKE